MMNIWVIFNKGSKNSISCIEPPNSFRWNHWNQQGSLHFWQQGWAPSAWAGSSVSTVLIPWGAAWSSLGTWDLGPPSPKHSPAATKWAPLGEPELWPVYDCHPAGWDNYTDNHIIKVYLSLYLNYRTSLHRCCILASGSWKSGLYHKKVFSA